MPPPACPSTSIRSISACISCIFACMAWACFINPIMSRIAVSSLLRRGGCRDNARLKVVFRTVVKADFIILLTVRPAPRRSLKCGLVGANPDNLGPRESGERALNKRLGAHSRQELACLGVFLLFQAGR